MGGLSRIARIYGGIIVKSDGKKVEYVWDYHQDKAIPKEEMTREMLALSEKAKWKKIKNQLQ